MSRIDLKFTHRDWIIAILVIFLALAYRVVIIVDRAHTPEISIFDPKTTGGDQVAYYSAIQAYHEGKFPPSVYFFQPGMSWFMIAASVVMRTADPGALRILVAWLASVNCGLLIAVTRLAFGRRWISVLAGLLLAIYPVGAFYDTDFVITSQATILVTMALFGVLWLWRYPQNWTGAVLLGLSTGFALITRFEVAALGVVMGTWLLWKRQERRTVFQLLVSTLIAVLIVMPIALHNRSGGADYLITPVGTAEVYRGNNRDANGTYTGEAVNRASATTNFDYLHFLAQDILLSPTRFIELELHKLGLYFSNDEPANNLGYIQSGEALSPALQINPLDFRLLMVVFLWGLFTVVASRQPISFFATAFLALLLATLAIWVEARIRTPVIAVMMPVVAYGLVYTVEKFPVRFHPQFSIESVRLRSWLIAGAGIAAVTLFFYVAEKSLPRPVTTAMLPSDMQTIDAVYDETLKLHGWKIQENYSRVGIIEPFRPYVITLYWSLLKPTTTQYTFSLKYFMNDELIHEYDDAIGSVSFPDYPTTHWQLGTIYMEHIGLSIDTFDIPLRSNGDLLLVVYPERQTTNVLKPGDLPDPFIRLAKPAIIMQPGKFDTLSLEGRSPAVTFGDIFLLKNWSVPESVASGSIAEIKLGWQTTNTPIRDSYIIGIYAFNSAGQFVQGWDSPPLNGKLLTYSLPTEYLFEEARQITMSMSPGEYTLYVGIYNSVTMERLSVPATQDNLAKLGIIEAE